MLNKRELKEIKERFESQKVIEDSQVDAFEAAQTALALANMLERLEWECNYTCKICNGNKHTGHKPDCELAKVLKGLEGSE